MDFDLKKKALRRLAESRSEEATLALQKEIDKSKSLLQSSADFVVLEQQLELLAIIGHRDAPHAMQILFNFLARLNSIALILPSNILANDESKSFYNADLLTVQIIGVAMGLRFLETTAVFTLLLALSSHESDAVRKKAFESLSHLAGYNMDVIYGDGKQGGIGVTPQKEIMDTILSFDEHELRRHSAALMKIVEGILSPTMQRISATSQTVTWSHAGIPNSDSISKLRQQSIVVLKRLYGLASDVVQKTSIISSLVQATRMHDLGQIGNDSVRLITRDTLDILSFFLSLVPHEEFEIIQKIEQKSYWIYHHAQSDDVVEASRAIETAINRSQEYEIYKTLIGYEGVFGDWSALKDGRLSRISTEESRIKIAAQYAESITSLNFAEWRGRILQYSKTRSGDLATFPVFYRFLELFASMRPELAVRLIENDDKALERFLIPILRGLGSSSESLTAGEIVLGWANSGRYLYPSIKQFLNNPRMDHSLLNTLFHKAIEQNDVRAVGLVVEIAVSNYVKSDRYLIDAYFLPALEALTAHSNADWIFDTWYRPQTKSLINDLGVEDIRVVLRNLETLGTIDFHAEEILYLLSGKAPEEVLDYLCDRMTSSRATKAKRMRTFDAIPFEFHKLPQAMSPYTREALTKVRSSYDGNYGMFVYAGARLIFVLFPEFSSQLERELLQYLKSTERSDIEFVLAILRHYKGQPPTHRVLKGIVRMLEPSSTLRNEVGAVLQSTGVVSGEFGFVEAYQSKREEMREWLSDPEQRIADFAEWYIAGLDEMISIERSRAEEEIALRRHAFGE